MKGDVRNWWGKLTDDDVTQIQGDTEKMIGKLQERYGYGRQQAEKELNDFLNAPEDNAAALHNLRYASMRRPI